jgi:hypothetical protein
LIVVAAEYPEIASDQASSKSSVKIFASKYQIYSFKEEEGCSEVWKAFLKKSCCSSDFFDHEHDESGVPIGAPFI